jgi:DNA-binding NtrC family response regulator
MATILLVDDDPLQASARKTILERRFPDVRRVGDPAEALCLVEQPQFARNLGLVISGHHHSGIGVPAFVAELHTRMPALPVLVLDDNTDDDDDFSGDVVYFLHRPVRADEMLSIAIQMLTQTERKTA